MNPKSLICVVCLVFCVSGCRRGNANIGGSTGANTPGSTAEGVTESRALIDKGKQLYRDDQDSAAVEAFEQAIKLDPNLAEAHFRLALAYEALNKAEEAEAEYKKAVGLFKTYVEQNPKDAEAHYQFGQTYAGLHQYSEAVREYRQATKLKTDDPDMYFDLGVALTRLAQYDDAATAFSKTLELDPENYRAQDALDEAREGSNRIKAGRKHQEDLLKKQKDGDLKKSGTETTTAKQTP